MKNPNEKFTIERSNEILKIVGEDFDKAIIFIDQILHFFRETYRETGDKIYLNGLKYYNWVKYETQKKGDL